jgi:allophanate hydrolase subunit 1
MTTVEILLSYATPPTEQAVSALASIKDVYGIRRLNFDHAARTLCVEYDATRLTPAAVIKLVREAGLEIVSEISAVLPPVPPSSPQPAPAA